MQSSSLGNADDPRFRQTHLFQMLVKVINTSAENATKTAIATSSTSTPSFVDTYSTSSLLGEEGRMVMIVVIGAMFALVTSLGNLMVMVSFKIDKQLQTISNYFLFSLAVADIAIGVISIPMFTYYTAIQKWDLGYTMCQFWLCIDYLMSNASVLNLLLISFDRYFSVTRPLSYRPRRTTKKALTMIACTYIISLILWPPWIISWPYIEGKFTAEPGTCVVQFLQTNPYVTVGTAVAAFYLPVTIMCILYTRVYWETQKRQKEFGKLQATQFSRRSMKRDVSSTSIIKSSGSMRKKNNQDGYVEDSVTPCTSSRNSKRKSWLRNCTGKSNSSSEDSSEAVAMNLDDTSLSSSHFALSGSRRRNISPPCTPMPTNFEDEEQTDAGASMRNGSARFRSRPSDTGKNNNSDTYTVLIELNDEGSRPSVRLSSCEPYLDEPISTRNRSKSDCNSEIDERRHSLLNKQSPFKNGRILKNFSSQERKSEKEQRKNERKQESKAAKTLSAILCAFIATWTPYNLIVCWEAFFPNTVPNVLWTFSYFLCYINSTINPLCYALCNARFRHTYMRILRCKFKAERPTMNQGYVRRN
ncbi:Muscarinic acetylcholine receptor gar-3 [Caenorhabditis elegans]|uniref:Isoform a of Muscarinic acetylcholine receptor gar-3 n=1 Tax=Caenorhabditis elegans TaxID=6239 RepID=Q9U7D5-2|nr:Muscarinic acetylcholine receptor gar-3 [Caenorhabditis elegans]AAD48771.1 muscarinic acetylcholine receptor [Caenorhabditis elegans]CAA22301.2 Muscarinic acetylcholine receptor gar-3 [Caenorhabditis elegans]|eukprot:NP_001024235.1 Muscarinic acetylcholine receptor gar-3 [Caenorhabditis elegans]